MPADTPLYAISARAYMPEPVAMQALLARAEALAPLEAAIMGRASAWTRQIRAKGLGHGVEAFLHAYSLSTQEGVALMCLAEALLRIPDAHTADALIRDTFEGRAWGEYAGSHDSWLVNISSWGLLLTGKMVDFGQDARFGLARALGAAVNRLSEPVIREALKKAMRLIGSQFVLGETVEEAIQHAKPYAKQGYRFSFDILGEGARSDAQAQGYVRDYIEGIERIGAMAKPGSSLFDSPGISVKLSALHPRYSLSQHARVMQELLPRLRGILLHAKAHNIAVSIDAEEASRLDIELLLFERLLADPALAGWNGVGFVLQAYQKRAYYVIDWLAEQARLTGRILPVRLVKGAYWDSEIKWAQLNGLPGYPVFTRKEHTDVSFLACADKLLSYPECFYPQFATHNARTISSIVELAGKHGWVAGAYEFQRLHGMGEALHDQIVGEMPSRIYAPVGPHKDLLAYLIRRLLENGANSSFVHLLMDESKTPEEILADPVAATKAHKELYNPSIPLPESLYGSARKNSRGMDFGNAAQVAALLEGIQAHEAVSERVEDDALNGLSAKIDAAKRAFPAWAATPVEARAAALERAAELIEEHAQELIGLCAFEAGKTLPDGVAEVREAADFCRYYAAEARRLFTPKLLDGPTGESNRLALAPRGVFACISPWNFPLAIFTGQVAAALAAGNAVVAKPAEQTPRIAKRGVELLHQAGVPKDALQLCFGSGEVVGAALVADARIGGVVFTGGTDTARHINRALAERNGPIIPLIAETGGQNCMVVDSSALPEQAIDDILASAFGSTGQRCSGLRVLFVQEEIADGLLTLLAGAMRELKIGYPADPATDIGPVIDAEAQRALLAHIEKMKRDAQLVAAAPLPEGLNGHFVAPHAFEIRSIAQLNGEVFGPVLHVVRFVSGALPKVVEAVNSTGYGLTFGIHSRVDEHVQMLAASVHAGNIYVNRSMIGATVGVQPFGGENLSGTGPKAGGPHYLLRFAQERTLTVNTAAIGGNIALMSA